MNQNVRILRNSIHTERAHERETEAETEAQIHTER